MIRISVWAAVFLVVLRICIGWHFFYEGYGKVRSAYLGKAAVNEKPFSSENYFRESEGPFGKFIKSKLSDPDQEVVDRLTPPPATWEPDLDPTVLTPPKALDREWDAYFNRFVTEFRLNDEQKQKAQESFDKSKLKTALWVRGYSEEKDPKTKARKRVFLTVKHKAPGAGNSSADFDQEVTPTERAAELKKKSEEVRDAYAKMDRMAKDVDVAKLRALKDEVRTIREELQKDLDAQTKSMKDGLAKVLDTRVTAYAIQADNKDPSITLQAMLTPMQTGKNPLARMWDEYVAYVKDFAPNMNDGRKAEIDLEVQAAKVRFDRWLADQDRYTGEPLPNKEVAEWRKLYADVLARRVLLGYFAFVVADEEKLLESRMQAELKTQSDAMRAQVGTQFLGEDRAKGYAPPTNEKTMWVIPKNWTVIDFLDWSTRWFLTVVGVLLMVGLLTRFSSFAAAGFLLLTVLTQPSVPWLPAPPNSEGNYLIINKNVIEMFALLVLMTTRTGKWFGLDAVISSIFNRR
ncbi:MAG TPA: hypothetical protein VKD71_07935 [Gemmataceae bacterium]|nr:hypothetical protein [Gemmataceae bacterium]